MDLVDMLRHDAEQLGNAAANSAQGGRGAGVRVKDPKALHDVMIKAADTIKQLEADHSAFIRAVLAEPDGVDLANRITQRVLNSRKNK